MKRILLFGIFLASFSPVFSQKIDSIYFHLYTDSLKKGQHNYINIDGKMSNGRWMPLSSKEIDFSCPEAKFDGNQLVIPEDFKPLKVSVKAILKSNPSIWLEKTIWIKQKPDPELPTEQEILRQQKRSKNKNR
jgi:hypothetical protein